jgi:hypothetical protein
VIFPSLRRRLTPAPFGFDGVGHLMGTIEHIVKGYRLNRQIGQPTFTITACEAAGMVPQLACVTGPFGVSVISGGGFDSITAKHHLAQKIAESVRPVRLLHIGDYDPSGVHLFSSLDEDVRAFLMRLNPNARVFSERVAILPEHVARFRLRQPRPLCRLPDGRSRHSENSLCRRPAADPELRPPPVTSTA